MPQLSPAAMGGGPGGDASMVGAPGPLPPTRRPARANPGRWPTARRRGRCPRSRRRAVRRPPAPPPSPTCVRAARCPAAAPPLSPAGRRRRPCLPPRPLCGPSCRRCPCDRRRPRLARRSAPAPSPAAVPPEEEPASWEKLVTDTDDPSAQLDTAPRSGGQVGKKSGSSDRAVGGVPLSGAPESSRRLWIVVGVVAAASSCWSPSAWPSRSPCPPGRRATARRPASRCASIPTATAKASGGFRTRSTRPTERSHHPHGGHSGGRESRSPQQGEPDHRVGARPQGGLEVSRRGHGHANAPGRRARPDSR